MAPTRSKKRKSTESQASVETSSFPKPPSQTVAFKTTTPIGTPQNRSPVRKAARGITIAQKQALIDNLQLEVTERARKLRAQYALQAQGLRTRIEIRVNRIPMALRKANMGDLFLKYSGSQENVNPAATSSILPSKAIVPQTKNPLQESRNARNSPSPIRPKRKSDEIMDKENEDLSNPKKRTKAPKPPARTTSRAKVTTDQVLSPRSANSRTLPKSPIRPPISPAKSHLTRPVSPLKPVAPTPAGGAASILTNMVEKAKSTRANTTRKVTAASNTSASSAGVGRGKRAPGATAAGAASTARVGKGRASNSSESSDASSGTTVITRAPPVAKAAAAKKGVVGTLKSIGTKGAKKEPASRAAASRAAPAATGRVLRTRG